MSDFTFTLKDLGVFFIFLALLVLIIYGILLLKNLIISVKHTNKILADTEEITAVAKKRVNDVDGIVEDLSGTMADIAKNVKGQDNIIKTITKVITAVTSLIGTIKKEKSEKK